MISRHVPCSEGFEGRKQLLNEPKRKCPPAYSKDFTHPFPCRTSPAPVLPTDYNVVVIGPTLTLLGNGSHEVRPRLGFVPASSFSSRYEGAGRSLNGPRGGSRHAVRPPAEHKDPIAVNHCAVAGPAAGMGCANPSKLICHTSNIFLVFKFRRRVSVDQGGGIIA